MKRIINLTTEQIQIIVGGLLGDAYCQRGPHPNSNCRIQFYQKGMRIATHSFTMSDVV